MSEIKHLKLTGPGYDLESHYIRRPAQYHLLNYPSAAYPFKKQGKPIETTPMINTSYRETYQLTHDTSSNPLPTTYWEGTTYKQIHKGGPYFGLGVNENRKR